MTNYHKGFRVDTTELEVVTSLMEAFQPRVVARAYDKLAQFLLNTEKAAMPYDEAIAHWHSLRIRSRDGLVAPYLLTDFDLVFIHQKNYFLGRCISADAELYADWCQQPKVSEYAYWEAGGRPSHLSAAQWAERARCWEAAKAGKLTATEYHVKLMPDLALFRSITA